MHRRTLLLGALASFANPASATPQVYSIGPNGAEITYTFNLQGNEITGRVPLSQAALRIDPQRLTASTVDVRANMRRARTGLVFATEAMKSASVLNTAQFPEARFVSTRVTLGPTGRLSDGARLDGNLTLRGVTRPISLDATLFRPQGSPADDLSRLTVTLRGHLSRTAYGAMGYPKLVADRVALLIKADIQKT